MANIVRVTFEGVEDTNGDIILYDGQRLPLIMRNLATSSEILESRPDPGDFIANSDLTVVGIFNGNGYTVLVDRDNPERAGQTVEKADVGEDNFSRVETRVAVNLMSQLDLRPRRPAPEPIEPVIEEEVTPREPVVDETPTEPVVEPEPVVREPAPTEPTPTEPRQTKPRKNS